MVLLGYTYAFYELRYLTQILH